jgi:hypothetical protein
MTPNTSAFVLLLVDNNGAIKIAFFTRHYLAAKSIPFLTDIAGI